MDLDIELFRYSRSIYGGDETIIGANWDLLGFFVAASMTFIVLHIICKIVFSKRISGSH
jgi:hypothetical protein